MAPFLGGIFRSGRVTPASSGGCTPDSPTPKSTIQRAPPSAFKRSQPSPALTNTPSTPRTDATNEPRASPAPIKVRDFAVIGRLALEPPAPPPARPLPPTPDISPLKPKGHVRSSSAASALSSQSSVKRNARPSLSQPHLRLPLAAFIPLIVHQRAASGPSDPSPSPLSATDVPQPPTAIQDAKSLPPNPPISTPDMTVAEQSQPVAPSRPAPGSRWLNGMGQTFHTPEAKRRPAKLTLRTSNLSPPLSPTRAPARPPLPVSVTASTKVDVTAASQAVRLVTSVTEDERRPSIDSDHTITQRNVLLRRVESDQTIRSTRPERPRSSSYGDVPLLQTSPLGPKDTPTAPRPAPLVAVPVLPTMSVRPRNPHAKPSRTRHTPDRTTTDTPLSPAPNSPAHTDRRAPSQLFEVISLPWTSSSAEALSQELGPRFDDLIAFTLRRLTTSSPRVLRPSVLRTAANEEVRLRIELARLRAKYDSVTHHRDGLLVSLTQPAIMSDAVTLWGTVDSLRRSMARCDRIARRMFICNDQIRQIEVQSEEHVVGALRVALSRAQDALRARDFNFSSESELESDGTTSCETSDTGHEPSHVDVRRVTFVRTPSQGDGSGAGGNDIQTGREAAPNAANRMSVATIISLNQLGFPLPPNRYTESPSSLVVDADTGKSAFASSTLLGTVSLRSVNQSHADELVDDTPATSRADVDLIEEVDLPLTGRSASTSQLELTVESGDEIVIYPPGHRRSSSLPVLVAPGGMDLPHTPWKDKYEHISVMTKAPAGSTQPLRVKGPRATRARGMGGKSLSLKAPRRLSDTTKRARRGRESQLETPASILLSLATAGLWTKPELDGMETLSP